VEKDVTTWLIIAVIYKT